MKLFLATSRPIGLRCEQWARACGFEFANTKEECDVYISVLSSEILKPEFLKGRRAYNFHPAILPQYGGSPVYSMNIINVEKESGVTLHEIDEGIDTGQIIAIERFLISENETAETLRTKSEEVIYKMFKRWIFPIIDNTYRRTYRKKELEVFKDLTPIVRALTLDGKEPCYYVNSKGEKVYVVYN